MKSRLINGDERLLVLLTGDEKAEEILQGLTCSALVIDDFDWNRDLSPWPAKAVFKGEDFSGEADETIKKIIEDPVLHKKWNQIILCGYSMAGLFALYAGTKVNLFSGIASCSGSLWFDGFTGYLREHPVQAEKIYLSVGDKEGHSRNARMRTVIDATKETAAIVRTYAEVRFELNPGNHFDDPQGRMRKGIKWLLDDEHAEPDR